MAKIDDLKSKLSKQKNLRDKFKKSGKKTLVDKIEGKIKEIEEKIEKETKAIEDAAAKKSKPAKKDKKPIAGTMTKEECNKLLEEIKKRYLKSEATKKKNIKSGRAEKDGSLTASASLDNEADTIEKKADDGQTLSKGEQKFTAKNIDKIVRSCVEMIKTQKDSEQMIKDLIRKLEAIMSDIKAGKLQYEG
jgi:hypothetical protein